VPFRPVRRQRTTGGFQNRSTRPTVPQRRVRLRDWLSSWLRSDIQLRYARILHDRKLKSRWFKFPLNARVAIRPQWILVVARRLEEEAVKKATISSRRFHWIFRPALSTGKGQ
jgi:hypothetical protein